MAKLRPGWTRVSGTAERFISPEGEEVSRRQYDNLRARELGWQSRSEYERRFEDPTYLWAWNTYRHNQKMTITRARQLDRMGQPLDRELLAAKRTGWGKTKAGRDPNGPMSKLLVDMGIRDPFAEYAVGETDARRRG